MGWWLFQNVECRTMSDELFRRCVARRLSFVAGFAVFVALVAGPMCDVSGEPISPQDREEISRLRAMHKRPAEAVDALIQQADQAAARGLPQGPLVNKIKEGLAKGVEPKQIESVLRDMMGRLETAQALLNEVGGPAGDESVGGRGRATEVLAEALARGVTPTEVREIGRLIWERKQKSVHEMLASGVKSLAILKEGGVPAGDGLVLVDEAFKQGVRSSELMDLAREIKKHGRDIREGKIHLSVIREAVARRARIGEIFREGSERQRGQGETGQESIDRGSRERSGRLREDLGRWGDGRPERSDRPDRSGRFERLDRPERPGGR